MIKRVAAIVSGILIMISLFASYSDEQHQPGQLLIWYIFTPKMLKIVVWIILFFLAARLIWGKPKDYSKYFYALFVKWWGNPKKNAKAINQD